MERLWKMLTPATFGRKADTGLLIMRLGLGLLMMGHGWSKLISFNEYAADFYNFIGLGGPISLGLTVFAEFFCSILLLFGLGTQLVLIPLTTLAMVIVFDVKAGESLEDRELVLLYLAGYVSLLLTGPGRYSIDYYLLRKKV